MNNASTPVSISGGVDGKAFARVAAVSFVVVLASALFDESARSFAGVRSLAPVSEVLSTAGNGLTLVALALGLYLAGRFRRDINTRDAGTGAFYSILLGSGAVHLLKAAFERPRPQHSDVSILEFLREPFFFDTTGKFNAFPSGHATVSFAVAFVLARRFPRFRYLFYGAAALVALARVQLGSHYPSDVAGGAVLGLAMGYLVAGGPGGAPAARPKWYFAALVTAALFISFFKSGSFLLFDVDEAVFSEASREMLTSGDFITPTYNYEPRYDKPILIYWFMSTAFALFGVSEFAARFTSGGFGFLLIMTTFFFVRRTAGREDAARGELPAYLTSMVLLLNLEFFVYSHSAVTDMTLTFFIASAMFAFYLGVTEDRRWFAAAWAASALAVLTKGVIGLMFPSVAGLVYLAVTGNLRLLKDALRPAYIGLFFLIAVPWFVVEYAVQGPEFFDEFIVKHHIKRYSDVISSHSGPFYYYVLVILAGFFPWVAFLPRALRRGVGELRRGGGLMLFAAVWFIFIFVFFSAAETKLPNYVFPLYPTLSIMAGGVLSELARSEKTKKPGLYTLILLSLLAAAALIVLPSHEMDSEITLAPWAFYGLGGVFLLMGFAGLVAYGRTLHGLLALGGAAAVLLVYLRLVAVPPVNLFMQGELHAYANWARGLEGVELVAYEVNKPSVSFYYRGAAKKYERATRDDLAELIAGKDVVVLTEPGRVEELKELAPLAVLDDSGEFVLMSDTELPGPPSRPTHK